MCVAGRARDAMPIALTPGATPASRGAGLSTPATSPPTRTALATKPCGRDPCDPDLLRSFHFVIWGRGLLSQALLIFQALPGVLYFQMNRRLNLDIDAQNILFFYVFLTENQKVLGTEYGIARAGVGDARARTSLCTAS